MHAAGRLPSFSGEYTASVPLTRIRDIAHRNDIPHGVKQEIKHTIQNKLHRNAGARSAPPRPSPRRPHLSALRLTPCCVCVRGWAKSYNGS